MSSTNYQSMTNTVDIAVKLVPCTDIAMLAEVARRAIHGEHSFHVFPYLVEATGAAGEDLGYSAALLLPGLNDEPLTVSLRPSSDNHLIIALAPSDETTLLVKTYAQFRNAEYVAADDADTLATLIKSKKPTFATVVGLAGQFDDRTLWRIEEICWAETTQRSLHTPFYSGFLVARDIVALSQLMARTLATEEQPAGEHVQIMPFFQPWPGRSHPANLSVLQGKQVSAETLLDHSQDGIGILSIFGHGTDDSTFLGQDVICGARRQLLPAQRGEHVGLPVCYHTGNCFAHSAEIIRASELRCQVVFANMCMGLKLQDSIFDTTYSLSLNFLDGWSVAYISTPLNRSAWIFENILFYLLCTEAGCTVGEALSLVNQLTYAATGEISRLYLIGDPALRIQRGPGRVAPQAASVTCTQGTWQIALEQLGNLAWAVVEDEDLWRAAQDRSLYALSARSGEQTSSPDTVYWGAIPGGEGPTVLILQFSPGAATENLARIQLTTTPPVTPAFQDRLSSAFRYLAPHYPVKLIAQQAIAEQMSQVQALHENLSQIVPDIPFTVGKYEAAAALQQQIDGSLDILERAVATALADAAESIPFAGWNTYSFGHTFKSVGSAEALADASSCRVCGGPLLREIKEYHLDRSIQRQRDLCFRCGPQRDAPRESGLYLFIAGSSHIKLNTPFTLDVHLHNTSSLPVSGTVALRIGKLKPFRRSIDPEFHRFRLEAGEQAVYPFLIDLNERILLHAQFAKVVVVENFRFLYSSRPIWIEP